MKNFHLFLITIFLSLLYSCNSQPKKIESNHKDQMLLTYKVIQIEENWGYEILIDNKLYIHQEKIPSIPGNLPFQTVEDAEKTAKLVALKIKKGILPPSVSAKEIDSLGIKY